METTIVYWGSIGILEDNKNGNYYSIFGLYEAHLSSQSWRLKNAPQLVKF